MSFLLDTNVLSELRKGKRANPDVVAWFAEVPEEELFLSVLIAGEIRQGIERLRRRDLDTAERLDRWLVTLLEDYADRILPLDLRIAELWGRLNAPDPLPAVDGLLAATAIAHDLTLVTRNGRDVARTGVSIVNPFND
ncbi:MAG TPA: type II toxin-antitoxin system VapC family toxin [Kofleriaceae bacterium]|nr:type II toxin-antitoxin system VapC family toxin [Kofleriaceae bacterium]